MRGTMDILYMESRLLYHNVTINHIFHFKSDIQRICRDAMRSPPLRKYIIRSRTLRLVVCR